MGNPRYLRSNPQAMQGVSQALSGAATDLDSRLNELDGEVREMLAGWQGGLGPPTASLGRRGITAPAKCNVGW